MKSNTKGTKSLSIYSGASMHLVSFPHGVPIAKLAKIHDLSKKARICLEILDFAKDHPVSVTCRRYGIARSTFYRWKRKYNPRNLKSLEDRSRRPKSTRKPTWTLELVEGIQKLRERYPYLGKTKLVLFLREEGFQVSASTVGRIIRSLKTRGLLREPERTKKVRVAKSKRTSGRPHAERKPRDYRVKFPGDLVAIDTLDIRPLPGKGYKQFTAQDLISRFALASLSTRATASAARRFLEELLKKSPFPVKAIQVDGGSEFYGAFEEACKE
ncbi:MAG: transposase, partial [Candidatus Atribacteria bacterium]|nr:transposase [Candidatus Atribacteria bacterium]